MTLLVAEGPITLPIALLTALLVEAVTLVWPRVYDCGVERPGQRHARRTVILPLVALAALTATGVAQLALVFSLGWAGALDRAYQRISLPVQGVLLGSAYLVARGDSERILTGVLLGGAYLILALVSALRMGPRSSDGVPSIFGTESRTDLIGGPGLGDTVLFAAIGLSVGSLTFIVLILALIILAACERWTHKDRMVPIGFYLAAALLTALVLLSLLRPGFLA